MQKRQRLVDVMEHVVAGDAAYGYTAIEAVADVRTTEPKQAAKTSVVLRSGYCLPVYLELRETHRHLQVAAYAARQFWGRLLESSPMIFTARQGYVGGGANLANSEDHR